MTADDLIDLQIQLEYQVLLDNRLKPFPNSTEQARYIAYRYPGGLRRFYHHALSQSARAALAQVDPFRAPEKVRQVLSVYAPCPEAGLFESYYFQRCPEPSEYSQVAWDDKTAIIAVDAHPVCWAWSERQAARCAEVAVETSVEFRCRGFARQAVCALARREIASGRLVFFSHRADNLASSALARSLGVVHFATCTAFD